MASFDDFFMELALDLAHQCIPTTTAFNVGAVLVDTRVRSIDSLDKLISDKLIFTGYSRELPGNTHAEQVCLMKHEKSQLPISDYILYTTMEPCTERLSGNITCTQNILNRQGNQLNIIKLVIGCAEPVHFVKHQGIGALQDIGIGIQRLIKYEKQSLSVNANVLTTAAIPTKI